MLKEVTSYSHEDNFMNNNEIAETVIGFDALYNSMLKCKKGVSWKNSVAYFYLHGIEETLKLERQLHDGTYKPKAPKKFTITHPKKREAVSIAFRDRVYQRSLNDNILYPVMTKSFIHQNMACQKGKGTDLARQWLDKYMKRAFFKYDYACSVLQCDIEGYYPNMRHHVAEVAFRKKLPKVAYEMTEKILRNQYVGEVGYNPGSQMIQIAGISVLDPLDHFIKEKLHIKMYIRYMDDFVLIHPDEKYLQYCKDEIDKYLNSMGYRLHPDKTKIFDLKKGIKMLGFIHRITPTGKIIRQIDPKNVKAERRKLVRMARLVREGKLTKEKVDRCYQSWKAHASKGNSFKLLQRTDKFYKELWRHDEDKQN